MVVMHGGFGRFAWCGRIGASEQLGIGRPFLLLYVPLSLRQRVKSARFCASWYDLSLKQRKRLKSAFQRVAVFCRPLLVRIAGLGVAPLVSTRPVSAMRREKDRRFLPGPLCLVLCSRVE